MGSYEGASRSHRAPSPLDWGGRQAGCPAAPPLHGGSRPIRDRSWGQPETGKGTKGHRGEERILVMSHVRAGQGAADRREGPCAGLQGQAGWAGAGLE